MSKEMTLCSLQSVGTTPEDLALQNAELQVNLDHLACAIRHVAALPGFKQTGNKGYGGSLTYILIFSMCMMLFSYFTAFPDTIY